MSKIVKLKNETLTIERCNDCPMRTYERGDGDGDGDGGGDDLCLLGFYVKMENIWLLNLDGISPYCVLDDKEDDKNG